MYTLRLLEETDAPALLDYHLRNREHLRSWMPVLPEEFYELGYQRKRVEHYMELLRRSEEFRFCVFDGSSMCAGINLTAVEYGAFQNGRLGYSVDCEHTGRGVATEFIGKVCNYAFNQVALHRLEANVMPRNVGSRRVLEKCGFQKVGYSPTMIEIAGKWEDHDMFARVKA